MTKENLIIDEMKKVGLGENEAKAYLTLLKNHPINGYALSKHSGIPRSKVYEVLENLKTKQMVFEQEEGKSKTYSPMEPEFFVRRTREVYDKTISVIDNYTQRVFKSEAAHGVRVIKGKKDIVEFIALLLRSAGERVSLSIWEEDIGHFQDEIDEVLGRGVKLRGIFFGEESPYSQLINHRRCKRVFTEKKERHIVLIVDNNAVVSGVLSRGEESQVTWTNDPGFVELSEDYIIHDISLNKLLLQMEPEKQKKYEEFLDHVRGDYFNG